MPIPQAGRVPLVGIEHVSGPGSHFAESFGIFGDGIRTEVFEPGHKIRLGSDGFRHREGAGLLTDVAPCPCDAGRLSFVEDVEFIEKRVPVKGEIAAGRALRDALGADSLAKTCHREAAQLFLPVQSVCGIPSSHG